MAERRRAQEGAAAAVLAAALACLRGPGTAKEPKEALTAAVLARPTLKTMQAALHLLHLRIRGAARTKKELQHIYPVLEPGQAKEFKAAMQEWVRELGAAGQLQPDSVKYFVSAYQGSAAHRAVLLLLDLSALALAKELGEGPHSSLPDADLLRPCCAAGAGPPPQHAHRAAADAQRQLQAHMDAVVAAMQRLKQLHAQAAGQLASAAALGPRVPLFAGSQAATKRGELVAELLAHGPSLTAQPEAVSPESWADLLAAGKGTGAAAAGGAATPPPATARRLSNPVQEASNFAAEGMAADADVLTVHGVLVQRLAAAGAALQAASSQSGAAGGSPELQAALAEAAVCRESLMLSVRQELAAARVRDEQQAATAGDSSSGLLQLLPPSLPPCNPVAEGMQMSQQAAAAAAEDAGSAWCATPEVADVRALRRSVWQQVLQGSDGSSISDMGSKAAVDANQPAAGVGPEGAAASPLLSGAAAAAAGSSSSKAPRARPPAARSADSPSLEDLISHSSRGLDGPQRLASLDGLSSPVEEFGTWQPSSHSAQQQQQQQQQHSRDQQQPSGSPCMAESCASFSIAGGSGRRAVGGSRPLRLAVSPMQSAAASFMPQRRQPSPHQQAEGRQQQPGWSQRPAAAPAVPSSPLLPLFESLSPKASSPAVPQPADSDGDSSGSSSKGCPSPMAPARSWRHAAAATATAAADAASPASGTSSRRRAASVAFTPPRRLGDSPLPELPLQRSQQVASLAVGRGGESTPVSRLQGTSRREQLSPALHAATPAPSPVLQPGQQQRVEPSRRQGGLGYDSPSSPQLLASCLKSKPLALSPFALAPSSPRAVQQQEQPWTLAAARSPSAAAGSVGLNSPRGSGALGSPLGSAGRRRSTVITTSSPRLSAQSQDAPSPALPHRLASSGPKVPLKPEGSDLMSGLCAFDSPIATSLSSRPAQQASRRSGRSTGGTAAGSAGSGSFDFAELQKRLLAIDKNKGRR